MLPDAGDIAWVDLDPVRGTEQAGRRPALVLSSMTYHDASRRAVVCPITSAARPWPFNVQLPTGLQTTGVVLVDQIRTIDRPFACSKSLNVRRRRCYRMCAADWLHCSDSMSCRDSEPGALTDRVSADLSRRCNEPTSSTENIQRPDTGLSKRRQHACLLRPRRRPEPDQGQEGRHHRLRQPGPRPCAQSARFRRQGGGGRAAQGLRRASRRPRAKSSRSWRSPRPPNGPT